jgi:hypothetical protein
MICDMILQKKQKTRFDKEVGWFGKSVAYKSA